MKEFKLDEKNFFKFLKNLPDNSVSLCCHDKGAGSHISSWFKGLSKKMNIYAKGPCSNIFDQYSESKFYDDLNNCILDSVLLISGTGWQTDIEHNARKIAYENNITSFAVLDHWINYDQRFVFNDIKVLPNKILVSDLYAKRIAKEIFPDIEIIQLQNIFLRDLKKFYDHNFEKLSLKKCLPRKLVYFTEPFREKWGISTLEPELQALKYLEKNFNLLIKNNLIDLYENIESINFKTHPSEDSEKYIKFIDSLKLPGEKTLNKFKTLEESILYSDIALGCETQALIASDYCNLKSISTMPPWAPKCRLPHDFIIHMRNLK